MEFKKLIFLLATIFILGCGAKKEGGNSPETFLDKERLAGLKGKIIFQSDREGNWEIFQMEANGDNLVRLTNNQADDEYPVFSPDGKQIAFKSNRTGKWQVFLMDADGENQRQLTGDDSNNYDPAWTPDGKKIAFTSDRGEGERIYLIDIETKEERLLTEVNFRSGLADFSPDGKEMLFTGNELGWNIYLLNLTDRKINRITSRGGACRPDWSPDGKLIAYVTDRSDAIGDIWLMDAAGQNQRQLTTTAELSDYYPAFSPDGHWIVYAASYGKEDNWDLYVISTDGKKRAQLTYDESNEKFPDWENTDTHG